jgi:glycosyltransferase involved in cell wall biosynthesis
MRILFVAPSAYLLGGVQDWLYSITLGLRNKGHDVNVAVPNNEYHNGILYNNHYVGLNATFFTNQTGSSQGRIKALSRLLLNNPTDIIVGVNIGDIYEAYKCVYHRLQGTKIVMSLHAIEGDYFGDIGKYSQLLDGVITTNKLTQRLVTRLNLIDDDSIFYAPYGVPTSKAREKEDQDNILRIAWVGRLENEQKRILDIPFILQSLDRLNVEYTLSIAGDGPCKDKLVQNLYPWINMNRVKLMGFLDKRQLDTFYKQHNILLITSVWETGPIVAWEAMLSGLVVVSSEYLGAASESALINEQTALLFPVGSNEAAARQLARLIEPEQRNKLATNGRQLAMSRYSIDSSLASWEQAFYKIMRSKPKAMRCYVRTHSIEKSGRLDSILGPYISEFIRTCVRRKGYCRDPGSEWPHSNYCKSNPKAFLEYAQSLEKDL